MADFRSSNVQFLYIVIGHKYGKVIKMRMLILFVTYFVLVIDLVTSSSVGRDCAREANYRKLPLIKFCSGSKLSQKSIIVIDGNLSTNESVKSCTCTAKAVFDTANYIHFQEYPFSPPLKSSNCNSKVIFYQRAFQNITQSCAINGSMPINVSQNLDITFIKETLAAESRYCFNIAIDQGDRLNITCNQTDLWQGRPKGNTNDELRNKDDESYHNLYIVIGSGFGGVGLFVLIIIFFIIQSRRKAKTNNEQQEDTDEYGRQYTSLDALHENDGVYDFINSRNEWKKESVHHVAYEVETNYSEIDLNELPNYQIKSNATRNNDKINDEKESYDTEGEKPYEDWDDSSSSVKRVIALGDDRCESAVVDKQSKRT